MKRFVRKQLSMLLSMMIAASTALCTDLVPVSDGEAPDMPAADQLIALPEEIFASITITADGELFADGRLAGSSFGGVSLDENSQPVFSDGGRNYTLSEAEAELGVQAIHTSRGEDIIISPFCTAGLIVRADKSFDTRGAVSVTEQFEGLYLLTYPSAADAYSAYRRLSEDSSVIYVEPDSVCTVLDEGEDYEYTPEYDYDPCELGGWGAETIGAKEFCSRIKEEKNGELPEIIVAVADTGINYDHVCLKDRLLSRGANFARDGEPDAEDHYGHGTHCAGIVCSATEDNVKLLPVKVLNNRGGGTVFSVYSGIRYAVDQGADVITLSLGFMGRSNLLEEAVEYARINNVAVCVAAGNEYRSDFSEAGCTLPVIDYTVTIGSMDESYGCSDFSNHGSIDFSAPGENILSSYAGGEEEYKKLSGTSMATPFAAACFADLFSYDPGLSVNEIYGLLKENALDICDKGYDNKSGWGMVNLRNFRFDGDAVAAPKAYPAPGMYDAPVAVTLSCDTEGARIYYTLDGTVPTPENGTEYDGTPVSIASTMTLRAVSAVDGIMGRYEEYKYFIDDIDPDKVSIDKNGILWEYELNDAVVDLRGLVESGKLPKINAIGKLAFKRNDRIEEVILPADVKVIGAEAFSGCDRLRRVTMDAEVICRDAFMSCKSLEQVNDSSITTVMDRAFSGCERLSAFDGTGLTEICSNSFKGCSSLDISSFDPSIIESYGEECFKASGISGSLNASAAVSIGAGAFENTHLSEVLLPESIDTIPDSAFKGCSALRHISAPGLKCVEKYGLALGNREFSPDTEVRADIDFSKLETAKPMAFDGYAFDKPESFDLLDDSSSLGAFAGAYGTKLTFPGITRITIGDVFYTDIDDIFVDLIELPQLSSFSDNARIGKFGALLIGDSVSGTKLDRAYANVFEEGGSLFTYEENETVRRMAELNGCDYGTAPAIYCPREHYNLPLGQAGCITAYSLGAGCSGKWLLKTASGEEELDIPGDMPIPHSSDECGSTTYIYRQYDENGEVIGEKEIIVDVIRSDLPAIEIEENGFELLEDQEHYDMGGGYSMYKAVFTAEKGGDYFVNTKRTRMICSENGSILFTCGNDSDSTTSVTLEAGKTYDITLVVIPDPYEGKVNAKGIPYIAIHTADDTRRCIGALYRGVSIVWDGFKGDSSYRPQVYIMDSNRYLSQGYDFEVVFDEPPHYGENRYTIQGIGNYYGILERGTVNLEEGIRINEWYDRREETKKKFAPSAGGLYKLVVCPGESILAEAEKNGTNLNYGIFDPFPEIVGEAYGVYGITYYKPASGVVHKGFSMSPDTFASVIEMSGSKIYSIRAGNTDNRYMITQNTIINECTVEYTKNYEYTGEAVSPEISIYTPEGDKLTEGEDYTVRVWSNTEPGLMYAYIEGSEEHPGCLCITMAIDGGNAVVQENGDIRIIPGGGVKVSPYTNYKLVIEKDTFISARASKGYKYCTPTISSAESGYSADMVFADYDIFIPAGTYDLYVDRPKSSSLMYEFSLHDELTDIRDTEISVKAPASGSSDLPEVEVRYEGEILEEGVDYEFEKEYNEESCFSCIVLWGENDFAGEVQIEYMSMPEVQGELPELSEGISMVHSDPELTEGAYSWTPSESSWLFSIGSGYEQLFMYVADENGMIVGSGKLTRWDTVSCSVVPGKNYIVKFIGDNEADTEIHLTGALKDLGQCRVICAKAAELGSPDAEVTFMDGDQLLVEGVDYIRLKDCGQIGIGPFEFVFEGIGGYFGQVCVPVHLYTKELPSEKVYELTENFMYRAGSDEEFPGDVNVMRFTAPHNGTAEYRITAVTTGKKSRDESGSVYTGPEYYRTNASTASKHAALFVYDSSGEYIGTPYDDDILTLKKGETVYIAAVMPYIWDFDETCREKIIDIQVSYVRSVEDVPAATTVTTTVSAPASTTTSAGETSTSTASQTTAVSATATAPVTSEPVVYGDVNCDGKTDASDASMILAEYAAIQTGGASTLNEGQRKAADVNMDGRVDASDASLVLAFYSYIQTGGGEKDIMKWIKLPR